MTSDPTTPQPGEAEARARVERAAADLGVEVVSWDIDPAFAATADFCERYGYTAEQSVNCILVAARTGPPAYVACCVQATRRLDVNGTVRRVIGVRKASFARPDEAIAVTGMLPDGVTPFGLPEAVPVLVDPPILELPEIVVGGGGRGTKLRLAPEGLLRIPGARLQEGLSRPAPAA